MKTLLLNGSPNEKGSTWTALSYIADSLIEEGVEAEIFHVTNTPIPGCNACYVCRQNATNRCMMQEDIVNVIIDKVKAADAFVIGSPVYYAAPNGHLLAILDRVFFSGIKNFAGKPAAAVCALRRGGGTAALEVLHKYFTIAGMPIAPSTYWPMIHGRLPEEIPQDKEGMQEMQMLGKTIAWMLKCFELGRAAGMGYPEVPGGEKVMTNFIR